VAEEEDKQTKEKKKEESLSLTKDLYNENQRFSIDLYITFYSLYYI